MRKGSERVRVRGLARDKALSTGSKRMRMVKVWSRAKGKRQRETYREYDVEVQERFGWAQPRHAVHSLGTSS